MDSVHLALIDSELFELAPIVMDIDLEFYVIVPDEKNSADFSSL